MAYSLQDTTELTALGDAIRAKTGGNSNMTVAEMTTAVSGISTGGGDITVVGIHTDVQVKSGAYYLPGPNSYYNQIVINVSSLNLPSHFYISYICCNLGTTISQPTYQNANGGYVFLYEYNNGTITMLRGSTTAGLKVSAVGKNSNNITNIQLKYVKTSGTVYGLYGNGSDDHDYLHIYYVE